MQVKERITVLHRNLFKYTYALFFLFQTFFTFSQSYYSVDPTYLKKHREGKIQFDNFYPDTSSINAHRFINRNFLGNIGLSSPQYLAKFTSNNLGFRLLQVPLEDYVIKKEEVEYFKTKGPFAQLTGIAGTKQLQLFKMLFSNSFENGLNTTLKLNRYTSQGFYQKQQTFTNNFYLSSHYTTKNKRFGFNTYVLINNNHFQENGGISYDTLRQIDLLVSKDLIPTKLTNATRENRELSAMYGNWFKLSKKNETKFESFLRLKTAYSALKYKYKDENSDVDKYYHLTYLDTVRTLDSTRTRLFNNELSYAIESKSKHFDAYVTYENEIAQYWQKADTTFMNHIVKTGLHNYKNFYSSDSLRYINLENSTSANFIVSGQFTGNYKLESHHTLSFYRNNKFKQSLSLRLLNEDRTPDYIFKHWYSNHFIWDNTFNNTQLTQAEFDYKIAGIKIGFLYKNITNYLYFDQLGYPMQYNGGITNTALKLNIDHVFFKHLGIGLSQTFQNSSSNVISLPKSVSIASLFYKGNLFKNNLQLCIGGQVEYYDQFMPYAYMPATQIFYIQEKYKAGNFTFVDVFLNARIRPVTLFIKMENVLHGIIGTNYSMVPGYYQPDRALRFGLTWLFFD